MKRFTFKNIKENTKRLTAFHKAHKNDIKLRKQEAKKQGVIMPEELPFDLKKALKSMQRKIAKYYGNTSRMRPHQSDKECARRLRVGSPAWHSAKTFLE
jgi:hypothetical protein